MDQEEAPADILKQWQEARANRRMQFKVGNYRDGDWVSNIRMLTGTIKADWIQLPVERYLVALPTLSIPVVDRQCLVLDRQCRKKNPCRRYGIRSRKFCIGKKNQSIRIEAVRSWIKLLIFFLLHAAKVRSSCEEGPGQSALQSAYHDPKLDVTELKQDRTPCLFRPKIANKQINQNQLDRRRNWQKSVGSKLVQGEDRKERVANRELCR